MDFLFFNLDGDRMFTRNDAETARWSVEEMSLTASFPYDPGKNITDATRVGFWYDGVFQPFEIRKVTTHEPDHYQDITAEHIVISELTDRVFEMADIENKTAGQALTTVLANTGWSVGTNTASGTSTVKLSNTDVWSAINEIKSNWNVYITPRVTFDGSGITHKYLDIAPAEGTFNGCRISINKNADTVGVTYDDSRVKTAVYGWGKRETSTTGGTQTTTTVTFTDTVWTETADHPAKPSGQSYIEDPEATELYGRNGAPRFGFYQNGDIDTGATLLQKTWEYLKTVREPEVSIDCSVEELHRLGYVDVPLKLHDIAIVEVEPIGISLEREIIQLDIDLIDPTQTTVTIGDYIPNIVYIAKENRDDAVGGGGGGGGGGQNKNEYKMKEFETSIKKNDYEISLRALQRDVEADVELLYSEIAITASNIMLEVGNNFSGLYSHIELTAASIRSEVTAANSQIYSVITQTASNIRIEVGNSLSGVYSKIEQTADSIRSEVHTANSAIYSYVKQTASGIRSEVGNTFSNVYSSIDQQADKISLVVTTTGSTNKVNAASIVLGINAQTGSSYVKMEADKIDLTGYVKASALETTDAKITNLMAGNTTASVLKATLMQASTLNFSGSNCTWRYLDLMGADGVPVGATFMIQAH